MTWAQANTTSGVADKFIAISVSFESTWTRSSVDAQR
jgi:hypothetical protein